MDPEYIIILYSKYSPQCQKILQVYNPNIMDYIKMVCIDNSVYRKKILSSKNLSIKTVPCVLLMYPGGKIEKFEGANVTEWILQQISQNLPNADTGRTELENVEPEMSFTTPISIIEQSTSMTDIQHTPLEDLYMDDSEVENQRLPIKREKSTKDIAAEMAAEREQGEKQDAMRKREIAESQFGSRI
jgi:hypothetical protein